MTAECNHTWDNPNGKHVAGKPWVGIKSKCVRTCEKCGTKEYYSRGMYTGWFSQP